MKRTGEDQGSCTADRNTHAAEPGGPTIDSLSRTGAKRAGPGGCQIDSVAVLSQSVAVHAKLALGD